MQIKKNALLLSTDTLPSYGLDLIFSIAKSVWFDWIDLAMRKWYDAHDEEYVQQLALKHDLPVYIIQTSSNLNQWEMEKALDLCASTNADTICINAPKITNFRAYDFITDNLKLYKENNPDINFTILNPENSKLFALPIPEYRFNNLIDIVKKYDAYIWLDISNMDSDSFENEFTRKVEDYAPYISVVYLSDKSKDGKNHLVPGEWSLDIQSFLKKLKKGWYERPISVKLKLKDKELEDKERLKKQLKKVKKYYEKYFLNSESWDDD